MRSADPAQRPGKLVRPTMYQAGLGRLVRVGRPPGSGLTAQAGASLCEGRRRQSRGRAAETAARCALRQQGHRVARQAVGTGPFWLTRASAPVTVR